MTEKNYNPFDTRTEAQYLHGLPQTRSSKRRHEQRERYKEYRIRLKKKKENEKGGQHE